MNREEPKKIIIRTENIVKRYFEGEENELTVLDDINFAVEDGEFLSIVGPSGSGKSTMMQILGVLDRPTEGHYWLEGEATENMKDRELSAIRNKRIGFVFQTYNLVSRSSAQKNVELPMLYAGSSRRERIERSQYLLELVGMGDRMDHMPNELSGGQKQRVAIARALANDPAMILADEPTGALDSKTGRQVMDLFHEIHQGGATVILITHNRELAEETDRIITLMDGRITSDIDKRGMNRPDDELLTYLSGEAEQEIDAILKEQYPSAFDEGFSDEFRDSLRNEIRKKLEIDAEKPAPEGGF